MSEKIAGCSIQLFFSPWFSRHIVFKQEFILGQTSKGEIIYNSLNFSHGLGVRHEFGIFSASLLASWMKRYGFENEKSGAGSYVSAEAFVLSFYLATDAFLLRKYTFKIGINRYLSEVNLYDLQSKNVFEVGVGIKLD
ncbi:hypothetical protein EH223_16015 [candidate division KSB1 bacterium]|nr:hypothetical protein [candidate division KSB1 bacterium]RQW01201.1 MAG: hypothetical protein EH223_16015 [candidate division KSB1 bacterium]